MSTKEERTRAAREYLKLGAIPVHFTIEQIDFSVPEMPGLSFSAKYLAAGEVTPDTSGDRDTPNGPPVVYVSLVHRMSCAALIETAEGLRDIPEWLYDMILSDAYKETDIHDAFLAAIGGQEKLEQLAIEEAAK